MFTTTKFSTWDLPAHIQSAIDGLGWEFATEVQRDTVPWPVVAVTSSVRPAPVLGRPQPLASR